MLTDWLMRTLRRRPPMAADGGRDVRGIAAGIAHLRSIAPPPEDDGEEPIFLLASGWRSGSTLLQRCIMSDSRVLMWGEPYHECGLVQALAERTRAFRSGWPKPKWFRHDAPPASLAATWTANLFPSPADWRRAQRALFDTAFAEPARRLGSARWGIKEVRWTSDDARYLRWLYPRSRLVFLHRNPLDAYRSYRRRGGDWYDVFPERQVRTAAEFGRHWRLLTAGFLRDADELDALVLRFEEIAGGRGWIGDLERHLDIRIDPAVLDVPLDGADAAAPEAAVDDRDRRLLAEATSPLARSLGYFW